MTSCLVGHFFLLMGFVCASLKENAGLWSSKPLRISSGSSYSTSAISRRLPQTIIIGVRKGGTRALLEMLNIHPDVAVAGSEIHFFNIDENYHKGLEWYQTQMPLSLPQQVTVEKTPGYFASLKAPERIWSMNSSFKLLLIVRDPVERLISDYTQILFNRKERRKPYQSLEKILIHGGKLNTKYKAIQRSLYASHLIHWLKFFPLEQIHIVDGENLIQKPLLELRQIEQFLGLSPRITLSNFYFNQTKGFFCLKMKGQEKCLDDSKGRPHPEVDDGILEQLCTYFRKYNEMFFTLVGKTFNWC